MLGIEKYSRPGLNDLDAKLSKYLTWTKGYFIEAGANDGYTQSNTYFLERMRGWRGLLVEPIPALFEKAQACRRRSHVVNCALVPFSRENEMIELTYGNLMSLVTGAMGDPAAEANHIEKARLHDNEAGAYRVAVRGRSLTALIDEAKLPRVDFLSLDVEGFEAEVLRGLDFSRHSPTYLCIEARDRREVEAVLGDRYEPVENLTRLDVLYRKRSST
jgi:FkbM family methyltransferase